MIQMSIFDSHFYCFFTCIQQQVLPSSKFRYMCLWNCPQSNDILSWWKSFWRLEIINAVLRQNLYKQKN